MSLELSTVGKIIGKQKNNENANTSTCGRRRETEEKEVRRDDRRRNGEDIILSFSFLVPGSWFLSTFHVASYLVPHSDFAFGIKVLQPFLALLRMYVSSVVRSLLLSSPILHTIVLIIIIRIFRIQGSSCFFVGLFFRLCLHQCSVTHLHHQT